MDSGISLEQHGSVLVVTLDRPKANAIDAATSRELYGAFASLMADKGVRAAVLTGAGSRFFSAGWDLKAAADGEAHDSDHGPGGFAGLTQMFGCTKPVVAAVTGSAYGGAAPWKRTMAREDLPDPLGAMVVLVPARAPWVPHVARLREPSLEAK